MSFAKKIYQILVDRALWGGTPGLEVVDRDGLDDADFAALARVERRQEVEHDVGAEEEVDAEVDDLLPTAQRDMHIDM